MSGDTKFLRAKFVTKHQKYAIPDVDLPIPFKNTIKELNNIVNQLLFPDRPIENHISFDFLVAGELLRVTLEEHLDEKGIPKEEVIDIEFVERLPAPSIGEWLLEDDWISSVRAFNNDLILTGCYDGCARLWSSDGRLLRVVHAHEMAVKSVAWLAGSTDNEKRFITASEDGTCLMWLWNVTDDEIKTYKGTTNNHEMTGLGQLKTLHTCPMPELSEDSKNFTKPKSVECVSASHDKTMFATGSHDCVVNIWSAVSSTSDVKIFEEVKNQGKKKRKIEDASNRIPIRTLEGSDGHKNVVTAVDWLDGEKVCSCSLDHSIRLWDVHTAQMTASIMSSKALYDISYSTLNQTILAASADRHIRLYDPRITTGSVVKTTFTSHTGWVTCLNWSPTDENLFVSGSYDCLTKLWDKRSPKAPLYDLCGHEDRILCCDWSTPSKILSGGADKQLQIYNKE